MRRYKPTPAALERLSRIENSVGVPTDVPEDVAELLGYISEWSLSSEHVAAAFGISTRTLGKLNIPHARVGMTVRYNPAQVRRYIEAQLGENAHA